MTKKYQWPFYIRAIIDKTYEGPRDKQLIESFLKTQIEVVNAFTDKKNSEAQFIIVQWCKNSFL